MAVAVVTLKIDGDKAMLRELDKLRRRVKRRILRKALGKASKHLVKETQRRVPEKTGNLKKSIAIKFLRARFAGDARAIVGPAKTARGKGKDKVSNDGWYGVFVEFGHEIKKGKKGNATQRTLGKVAAKPFLRPAFDANVKKMFDIIAKSVEKDLYA